MEDIGLTKINMNIKNMEGGCLCGAVRYCVSGSPFAMENIAIAACVKKLHITCLFGILIC